MHTALKVYSWRGILSESIEATDIKSRADARKYGPFADFEKRRVGWVRWGYVKETGKWRKAHFRHFPNPINISNVREELMSEIHKKNVSKAESQKHEKAKRLLASSLKRRLLDNKYLQWAFKDKDVSPFPITGNLLSEVVDVQTEYPVKIPFGKEYRFDIALLGDYIKNKPIILGAIEIEYTHEFEMTKCLMCKTLGFPLVSIDISEIDESNITEDWIEKTLIKTTQTSSDSRRRNYIYIHNSLYPVYMDIPSNIFMGQYHYFIIFIDDNNFDNLIRNLLDLKKSLGIFDNTVQIQKVICKNEQNKKMLYNEGSIAGHDWYKYNSYRYIRVILQRPTIKCGPIYKYHLAMMRLLNSHYSTLVGYKHRKGKKNENTENRIWVEYQKLTTGGEWVQLLPKNVSEPVSSIISVLETLR